MRQYNVGMVGFGFMGKAHTFAYRAIPFFYGKHPININLRAVCCATRVTADRAAEFGYEFGTTDLDEFFHNGLDIVHICAPNAQHKPLVVEAVRRGLHVYCEKPLALNGQEAVEIGQALTGKDIITQMGFQSRFYSCVIRAKELLDSGRLGLPLGFHLRYYSMNRLDGSASPNALATGTIQDVGSHLFDMAYFLLGEFASVAASTKQHHASGAPGAVADDAFYSIVRMKNGAEGIVEASKIVQGSNNEYRVEINCTKGSIRFNIENPDWLFVYDANDVSGPYGGERGYKRIECLNRYPDRVFPTPRHSPGWLGGHIHAIYHFLTCIKLNQRSHPSLEDGIYTQIMLDQVTQSARDRRWIDMPATNNPSAKEK